ncbi:ABC transporter permease [Rhodococcus sp. WS3]|uniref:ABC transporter permease n=1 Tax=Rhodococcus sp. WS3 TaxID=2486271 RepID=UPI001143854E|nr:ABC transporter permease [Rhodococcus sp. WS3]ROZ45657.1 ABC transporter permease [Rhodococcus sp. WS3]
MKLLLLRKVVTRSLIAVPILLVVTLFTYVMMFQVGDPASAIAGDTATPEQIAAIRSDLGLDRPVLTQYFSWLGNALQGDLGASLHQKGTTTSLLADYLPPTVLLVGSAMSISVLCSVIMGLVIGLRPDGWLDRVFRAIAMVGMAIPNFLLGLILVLVFSVWLKIFPAAGYRMLGDGVGQAVKYLALPVLALSLALICQQVRTFRASLLKEYEADYVRTARMKNLSEPAIFFKHVVRNAAAPLITVIGIEIGALVTGAILVEAVFAIQGVGTLTISSINSQDFAIVQALVAITALVVIGANLIADVISTWLNPVGEAQNA